MDFERDLGKLAGLGFCDDYCERLRKEYYTGDQESIRRYVRAIVVVYDDRKEYVESV